MRYAKNGKNESKKMGESFGKTHHMGAKSLDVLSNMGGERALDRINRQNLWETIDRRGYPWFNIRRFCV